MSILIKNKVCTQTQRPGSRLTIPLASSNQYGVGGWVDVEIETNINSAFNRVGDRVGIVAELDNQYGGSLYAVDNKNCGPISGPLLVLKHKCVQCSILYNYLSFKVTRNVTRSGPVLFTFYPAEQTSDDDRPATATPCIRIQGQGAQG